MKPLLRPPNLVPLIANASGNLGLRPNTPSDRRDLRGKCEPEEPGTSAENSLNARDRLSHSGTEEREPLRPKLHWNAAFVAQLLGQALPAASAPDPRSISAYDRPTRDTAMHCAQSS